MEQVVKSKTDSGSASELMTVIGVVAILVVMIIPLPSILLDFLLALNITVAITILLIAMYTLKPLDFYIFPPVTSCDDPFQAVSQCRIDKIDTFTWP